MSELKAKNYIHIDIQLGAICVTLYRDAIRVRSATHTTKIRTTLLRDVMSEYASALLHTCEKARSRTPSRDGRGCATIGMQS